jgi:hypothetical protein
VILKRENNFVQAELLLISIREVLVYNIGEMPIIPTCFGAKFEVLTAVNPLTGVPRSR